MYAYNAEATSATPTNTIEEFDPAYGNFVAEFTFLFVFVFVYFEVFELVFLWQNAYFEQLYLFLINNYI